jgi:hypothetical protein
LQRTKSSLHGHFSAGKLSVIDSREKVVGVTDLTGGDIPGGQAPEVASANLTEAWTALASNGAVVFSRSQREYAVYDGQRTFGRWPLTEEGHRYAVEAYEAHAQSMAHGLAYQATGYQDPGRLGLPTDPIMKSVTYASPMSFVGSTRRILAWSTRTESRSGGTAVLVWTAVILALLLMWSIVAVWYVVIFGFFGIFVIPYRLVRRSQRKNLHVQKTTLATQQAMLQQMTLQQEQMLRQQQRPNGSVPAQALAAQAPPPAMPAPPG